MASIPGLSAAEREDHARMQVGLQRVLARPDRPVFATLVSSGGERFRLVVSEGEILDTDELPHPQMPYGHFRPARGVRDCMNAWLRLGGPHHQVLNPATAPRTGTFLRARGDRARDRLTGTDSVAEA